MQRYEFEIHSSHHRVRSSLYGLSREICPGSEVYLIAPGGERKALGHLSYRAVVNLCVATTDYTFKNYTDGRSEDIRKCIDLAAQWVLDASSVSKKSLNFSVQSVNVSNFAETPSQYALWDAVRATIDFICADPFRGYVWAARDVAWAGGAAAKNAEATWTKKDAEYIRQGSFILDYLNSGSNLFHLD